jgi:predicted lipoprotein with Yx(FWY)xxD motif
MLSRTAAACALLAVAGLASACSSNKSHDSTLGTGSSSPAAEAETIATATNADLGTILVDEDGKALYYFLKDKTSTSTCNGSCANVWPPVTTSGAPIAGTGTQAALLGTTKRSDGSTQVTYDGHPLYYYVADTSGGDAKGQDLSSFGAKWYVVAPDGKKVDKDADSSDVTAAPSASSNSDSGYHY